MTGYQKANLDELASTKYPHWIPIRHHFGIETFGMNAYRRDAGEGVALQPSSRVEQPRRHSSDGARSRRPSSESPAVSVHP